MTRPAIGQRSLGKYIISPYIAQLGMGLAAMLDYRPGRMHYFTLTNPYSVPVLAGDGAGIFEYLERVGVEAAWEVDSSGDAKVTFMKVSERPVGEERLAYEKGSYLPGSAELDFCPRCRVPGEVSGTYDFDPARGSLTNRFSGAREVIMPTQSISAIFRELERELGSEIPAIIADLERQYIRESLSRRPGAVERRGAVQEGSGGVEAGRGATSDLPDEMSLLEDFAWRGIGNPVGVTRENGASVITVENPFHPAMVAGRVAGLYEADTGGRVGLEWAEEAPGRLRVRVG